MLINIPTSPMIDANGRLAQEWLILINQIVRAIDELEKANKVVPPP